MNQTNLIAAVVLAIIIVLSVALLFNSTLDSAGNSLFGDNTDGGGFFDPGDGDGRNDYEFPTSDSETEDTSGLVVMSFDSL